MAGYFASAEAPNVYIQFLANKSADKCANILTFTSGDFFDALLEFRVQRDRDVKREILARIPTCSALAFQIADEVIEKSALPKVRFVTQLFQFLSALVAFRDVITRTIAFET